MAESYEEPCMLLQLNNKINYEYIVTEYAMHFQALLYGTVRKYLLIRS